MSPTTVDHCLKLVKNSLARVYAENGLPRRYTGRMDFKLVSRALLLAFAGGSFALTAFAQWQWIDKDGRKVFSDRSPPAEIQEKNILKRPSGAGQVTAGTSIQSTAVLPAAPASAAPNKADGLKLSGKDAQLEAKKKQAEEEEAAKKKDEEEKIAKAKAENCERAKKGLASLQSGVRIAVINAKGEREFMDDTARAGELKRLQGISSSDCK